jgi:dCTP deaminase
MAARSPNVTSARSPAPHSTAGFTDPGFTGQVRLQLSKLANLPTTLRPGLKIDQSCLFRLEGSPKYRTGRRRSVRATGASAAPPSRSYLNFRTRADD